MKVLFITDHGTIGGATHSFIEMVIALRNKGIDPVVITSIRNEINALFDSENIPNYSLGHRTVLEPVSEKGLRWLLRKNKKKLQYLLMNIIALQRAIRIIRVHKVDLIHTNSARNDIGCIISSKTGIPHVMHIREFADSDFDCIAFRNDYINLFNRYTTKFISISEAVKQHWVRKGIDINKVCVIYNGINYNDISISDDNSKLKSFKMIIAGGVFPTKGQHLAVEAIGHLPSSIRSNVSLDVAGWYSEKYVKEMKCYAAERGYEKQIQFLGSINDVHERLGNYQIGLMCSRAEGFGRVTAEYMHAQLGVVASDSGANPELIQDGVNGLLFKSGDAVSLAECILKLYHDRELLIRLSHAAKEKAIATYTQNKNANEIFKTYQEIIN